MAKVITKTVNLILRPSKYTPEGYSLYCDDATHYIPESSAVVATAEIRFPAVTKEHLIQKAISCLSAKEKEARLALEEDLREFQEIKKILLALPSPQPPQPPQSDQSDQPPSEGFIAEPPF